MQKKLKVPYLNLSKTNIKSLSELKKAFLRVIKSGRLVLGEEVENFENEYSKFSQVKYTVGVASGLDALILSLLALGIKNGDEVIVPSNTYIATLIAVSRVGARPILVEPKITTYNIDPDTIENAITKNTKAIIPVHLFGQACEMDRITEIAEIHKLNIVEDNAQSHGASFGNKFTGSFGLINATSFYPGKNLGALGDGGAITTDSKRLDTYIRILRNYGSREKYINDVIGYNSRLDELQAAFLRTKLNNLKENNNRRIKIALTYIQHLKNIGDLILPATVKNSTHIYHVFTVRTKKRDELQSYLYSNGIQTLIHYPIPPHLQKAYRDLEYKRGDFPIAEELANTSLSLPISPWITQSEVTHVIDVIRKFFKR